MGCSNCVVIFTCQFDGDVGNIGSREESQTLLCQPSKEEADNIGDVGREGLENCETLSRKSIKESVDDVSGVGDIGSKEETQTCQPSKDVVSGVGGVGDVGISGRSRSRDLCVSCFGNSIICKAHSLEVSSQSGCTDVLILRDARTMGVSKSNTASSYPTSSSSDGSFVAYDPLSFSFFFWTFVSPPKVDQVFFLFLRYSGLTNHFYPPRTLL